MELIKLYDIATKENIPIINFKMKNKAIIGCIDDNYMIGLNYSVINDFSEEKTVLAEELGHYYTNSLYNCNYSTIEIEKREFRANKWAFKTLIPVSFLLELFKEGYTTYYEIAEQLGVTEKMVKDAYNYYIENNLIFTNEKMLNKSI